MIGCEKRACFSVFEAKLQLFCFCSKEAKNKTSGSNSLMHGRLNLFSSFLACFLPKMETLGEDL